MIKRLVAHGNSAALIIDKPILQLLKVDENTTFEITTDGKNLIISPVGDAKREKKIKSSFEKINKRHQKTLLKLAK